MAWTIKKIIKKRRRQKGHKTRRESVKDRTRIKKKVSLNDNSIRTEEECKV